MESTLLHLQLPQLFDHSMPGSARLHVLTETVASALRCVRWGGDIHTHASTHACLHDRVLALVELGVPAARADHAKSRSQCFRNSAETIFSVYRSILCQALPHDAS